jgi:hypothetical protein
VPRSNGSSTEMITPCYVVKFSYRPSLQRSDFRNSESWLRMQNIDPLADSDDEGLDDHARLDYRGCSPQGLLSPWLTVPC